MQKGSCQDQHHPLVVEIGDIGLPRHESGQDKVLDDINISNEFSIVADAYANENFHNIKYVEYMGTKWKISTVTVQRPRLILSAGGVYNGPQT